MQDVKMLNAGEQGLVVEFGKIIDEVVNAKVSKLNALIKDRLQENGIIETVPTYRSLLIYFDPFTISKAELRDKIHELLPHVADATASKQGTLVHIPVCYQGEEFAPDLTFVCEHTGLSTEEVIKLHTEPEYLVYMIGFLAGFPYLGGMNEKLATPRLKQPRTKIMPGSVGIADKQTGIYPVESPGGWQLIGRTPVPVYDPNLENPFLFKTGDYLKFESISLNEYNQILKDVQAGTYKPTYSELGGGK